MAMRSKRLNVVILAMLILFYSYGSAFSDVFFSTFNGKGSSMVGHINPTKTGFVVNKKNADLQSRVFGYNVGTRVLVSVSVPDGDDTALIYDSINLSEPIIKTRWPNVRDIADAAYLRGYLYVAAQGSSNIAKIDTNFNTRKEIDWVYPQRSAVPHVPNGYTAKAISVTTMGDEIYGLFTISNSQGEHMNSVLVKLADDITTLRTLGYAAVVPDATAVFVMGNDLYVVGRGKNIEKDTDPRQSLIQKVNPGTMSVTNVVSAYDLDSSGGNIEALAFTETGDAFVVTHKALADKTEVKYYLLKGLNSTSAQDLMTLSGGFSSLRYDAGSKFFWVSNATSKTDTGAQLYAFDAAGKKVASFNASELGGTPYSLTIANGTGGSSMDSNADSSTSSGGCSTGGYLSLFLLLPFGVLPLLSRGHAPDQAPKHPQRRDQ